MGSKEANSDDNYLLPEFIYGVFDQTKIDDKEKRIIKNNLPNKEKYSVFYADYSDEPIYYSDEPIYYSDEIRSVPRK